MRQKTIIISMFLALLVLFAINCREILAGGFMVPHQTARGLGLASAVTAGVDDPSAVYYNPAALSEVNGNNLLVTGSYINVINSVENGKRKAVNEHDDNFLATLFANYHVPGTDFTIGMGTYTPFGLATTYEKPFTRFAAQRTELKTIFVTPALSWHPSKYFSAGAGFSFVHSSGLFSRAVCFAPPGVPDPITGATGCTVPGGLLEGRLRLTDTANAFTYNVGLLGKPTDNLRIGFSYRARTDLIFDHADVKFGGVGFAANRSIKASVRPIPLPPVIDVGLFWQINRSWGVEFVYEHARWSEFERFAALFPPSTVFLGKPVPGFNLPEKWKDTSTLRLGSYYSLNKNWEIRGGIALGETPIPNRTLNPAIPGADQLSLNGGFGYKWGDLSVDLGYAAVFYKTRRITNNELEGLPATGVPFTGAPGKDKHETFNNFVSLSFGYRF
jgi:long-chain fatty acid transport protein